MESNHRMLAFFDRTQGQSDQRAQLQSAQLTGQIRQSQLNADAGHRYFVEQFTYVQQQSSVQLLQAFERQLQAPTDQRSWMNALDVIVQSHERAADRQNQHFTILPDKIAES